MKKAILAVLVIIAGLLAYLAFKPQTPAVYPDQIVQTDQTSQMQSEDKTNQVSSSTISEWKTYTNIKYGYTFQYPQTWTLQGVDANAIDSTGNTIAINTYLKGVASNTSITIQYLLPPKGAESYQYIADQFDSSIGLYKTNKEKIQVAGTTALEANTVLSINGKGNPIPPLKNIIVDFLDKKQTGSFELQFQTPENGSADEVNSFNKLLTTFKFID